MPTARPSQPDRRQVLRRSVLLGVPAAIAATQLAPQLAQAAPAPKPAKRVIECAADLMQES